MLSYYIFLCKCMPTKFQNFNIKSLIYKATRDGFGSRDFLYKVLDKVFINNGSVLSDLNSQIESVR